MIADVRGEDFDITYRNPKVCQQVGDVKPRLTIIESLGVPWEWIHTARDGRWRSCLLFAPRHRRLSMRHWNQSA
jgi:hypothetical protein